MPKIIKDGRIYGASPSTLSDLADTTVSSPTNNQVLKYDSSTQKWVNGVGSAVISCTQTEYNAWKTAGTLKDETMYVLTDAPNLNATAQDLSYDGGATSTHDEVESVKTTVSGKADKAVNVTVSAATGVVLKHNSSVAVDKLVACNFALEKTGGWSNGWQVAGTVSKIPSVNVSAPLWNITNGVAMGMVRIDATTGNINLYIPTAADVRAEVNICYST